MLQEQEVAQAGGFIPAFPDRTLQRSLEIESLRIGHAAQISNLKPRGGFRDLEILDE